MSERRISVWQTAYATLWKSSIWRIQLVSEFQLGKIWATNLRSMIQAEVVHHSLAKILSQATVDHNLRSRFGATVGRPHGESRRRPVRRSARARRWKARRWGPPLIRHELRMAGRVAILAEHPP